MEGGWLQGAVVPARTAGARAAWSEEEGAPSSQHLPLLPSKLLGAQGSVVRQLGPGPPCSEDPEAPGSDAAPDLHSQLVGT